MKRRVLVSALVSLLVYAGPLKAQQGSFVKPAERPPASFDGFQYIDSKGCVFIRAGRQGDVVWVPRVTRSRVQMCGHLPTFANPTASDGGNANISSVTILRVTSVDAPQSGSDEQGAATGVAFVQLGLFGNEDNARQTENWINSQNLPVTTSLATIGAIPVTSVAIGPINDLASLREALELAMAAGYADAFLR